MTKTHIVQKNNPTHSLKDNFLEKNDEKLKRILSEKVGALKKVEESSPKFSKDLSDIKKDQKSFHEANQIEGISQNHENSKENPIESPEIQRKKHFTEGDFSPDGKISPEKNIPFSERTGSELRKQQITNFNVNFNETVRNEEHPENERNQEEEEEDIRESEEEEKNKENETENENALEAKIEKTENIQNNENQDNKTCLICFDRDSDAVIMDCGHGGDFPFCKLFAVKLIFFPKKYRNLLYLLH